MLKLIMPLRSDRIVLFVGMARKGFDESPCSTIKNEKTLEFIEKTRVLFSEVDGGRTRNLRIDSPVL